MQGMNMRKRLVICSATLALFASVIPALAATNGKIVFASGRNGTNGIWVMNPDGSGATSLISNVSFNYNDPVWSPNGTKIAFTSNMSSGNT
jgi:Tol biopolymer transport system component